MAFGGRHGTDEVGKYRLGVGRSAPQHDDNGRICLYPKVPNVIQPYACRPVNETMAGQEPFEAIPGSRVKECEIQPKEIIVFLRVESGAERTARRLCRRKGCRSPIAYQDRKSTRLNSSH